MNQMSSEELFELARERQRQEQAAAQEQIKQQIDVLVAERNDLIKRHKTDLRKIDNELQKLRGTSRKSETGRKRGQLSSNLLEVIEAQQPISSKALKKELEKRGFSTKNLSQTMAYLKRKGVVDSPSHGVYQLK